MSVWRDGPSDARFANLDAAGTVELCNSLADYGEAGGLSPELMLRVGRFAEGKYGSDPDVLLAAARMYFLGGEPTRARSTLLRAARRGLEDARLRQLLAEVLRELGEDDQAVDQVLHDARGAGTDPAIPPISDLPVVSEPSDLPVSIPRSRERGQRPEDVRTEVSLRARKLKEKNAKDDTRAADAREPRSADTRDVRSADAREPRAADARAGVRAPVRQPSNPGPNEVHGEASRASRVPEMPLPRSLRIKLLDPEDERRRLDPYEIIGEIASGGMATVFLARRPGAGGFQRFVAIKRLYPHLAADEQFIEMFLDEARLAAGIHNPHVVSILEIDQDAGGYYLVMEFIEGDTLGGLTARAVAQGAAIPRAIAARIVLDALAGLHAAHEVTDSNGAYLGLVHRDCTPQNILVGVDGSSRITDFGVARAESRLTVTRPQMVKGKVAYLSPEQAYAQDVDRRSDLFTMGIVLWEALAGRTLFQADTEPATLSRLLSAPIPSVRNFVPDTPPALDEVCRRALARDRGRRFRTAAEMADALERALHTAEDAVASPRDVGVFVEGLIGPEIAAQREAVRAWLTQNSPADSSPMSRRSGSLPGRGGSLPSIITGPSKGEPVGDTPAAAAVDASKVEAQKADTKATADVAVSKDEAAKEGGSAKKEVPHRAAMPALTSIPAPALPQARWKLPVTLVLAALIIAGGTAPIWIKKSARLRAVFDRFRSPPAATAKGGARPGPPRKATTAPVATTAAPRPADDDELGPDVLGQPTAAGVETSSVPDASVNRADAGR